MAKIMARLLDDTVVQTESWNEDTPEEFDLKNVSDYPVMQGDIYSDGLYYRDGVRLLTPIEEIIENSVPLEEVAALIEMIYQDDLDMIG